MGLLTQAKAQTAQRDAKRAREEGRRIFIYQLAGRLFDTYGSASGFAEQIEVIEDEGWRLDQLSFNGGGKGDGVQLAVFRRHEPMPPPPPAGRVG
ncbi:MAG: hypothetical protein ABR529_15780 [Actinomycetota bacterium]